MKFSFRLVLAVLFLFSFHRAHAQTTAAFPSLTYPHSIISGAMGELGVTMMNTTDAMQYNPANLVHSGDVSLTFYRDPFMQIGRPWPLTSVSMSVKPFESMSAGFEYTDQHEPPEPIRTVEHPEGTGETFDIYERSFAGAFALSVGKGVSLGAEIRYALTSIWSEKIHHTVFSAGLSYTPVSLEDRMHLGFSLMNFGTSEKYSNGTLIYPNGSVQTEESMPMPARIHLGADYAIVSRPLFDITLALGFTKPIDKRDESPIVSTWVERRYNTNIPAQSSFESLFTAWSDFPEDVTTHIGLGYRFKPLPLGHGVSFFQEMYLGYFSVGPSFDYYSLFTHGVRAGIEFGGVQASAGYAGRWHDNNPRSVNFGYNLSESFQFNVGSRINPFTGNEQPTENSDRLSNLILSAGYSHCTQLGKMKRQEYFSERLEFAMPSLWSVESDFYLSDNSALIASFAYGRMEETLKMAFYRNNFDNSAFQFTEDIETLSLESGYRYHPLGAVHPLFVQASLGIMRLNAVDDYYRLRHDYYTYDNLVVGCVLPLGDTHVVVMPKAGLRTIYWFSWPDLKKFSGYNQYEVGLNVGYAL